MDKEMEIKRVKVINAGSCSTCNRKKANVWEITGNSSKFRLCNHCMGSIRAMHYLYYGGEDQ